MPLTIVSPMLRHMLRPASRQQMFAREKKPRGYAVISCDLMLFFPKSPSSMVETGVSPGFSVSLTKIRCSVLEWSAFPIGEQIWTTSKNNCFAGETYSNWWLNLIQEKGWQNAVPYDYRIVPCHIMQYHAWMCIGILSYILKHCRWKLKYHLLKHNPFPIWSWFDGAVYWWFLSKSWLPTPPANTLLTAMYRIYQNISLCVSNHSNCTPHAKPSPSIRISLTTAQSFHFHGSILFNTLCPWYPCTTHNLWAGHRLLPLFCISWF